MTRPTIGDICAGYGGLALALASACGATPIWHAETDEHMNTVLAAHWTDLPNVGDITTTDWSTVDKPTILAAGFPCQPISAAGLQRHREDARFLWPSVARAIAELQPETVFLENVQNIVSIDKGSVLAEILGDLRDMGYAARWCVLGACAVGMAHHRHRWFLRAHRVDNCDGDVPEAVRVPIKCGAPIRRTTKADKAANAANSRYAGDKRANAAKMLPTPVARDGDHRGEGDAEYWQRRRERTGRVNGIPLGAAVRLMPTPRARDFKGADNRDERHERGTAHSGDDLATAVTKLPDPEPGLTVFPTPRASDSVTGSPNQHGSKGDLTLPSAVHRLLPTPTAGGFNDGEDVDTWKARRAANAARYGNNGFGVPLGMAVRLLPTPTASDGTGGAGHGDTMEGSPSLRTTVGRLLPTPTAADSRNSRNATADRAGDSTAHDGWTLSDVAHAEGYGLQLLPTPRATDTGTPGRRGSEGFRPPLSQVVLDKYKLRFAEYADAIARQVWVTGIEPPEPTEPNRNGEPRLAPAFAEWLMGLPYGWVTDHLPRVPALKGIGNGVVPLQAEVAWHLLAPPTDDPEPAE